METENGEAATRLVRTAGLANFVIIRSPYGEFVAKKTAGIAEMKIVEGTRAANKFAG